MKRKVWFRLAISLLSLLLCALFGEIMCRLAFANHLQILTDERNLAYQHDPLLGWFPISNSCRVFVGSRPISVRHNSRGFRDHEAGSKQRPRILFLGDSYVWGYDVEEEERFTERLQKLIPNWEIINLGVSGYGTDQEFLLLANQFAYYQPEIVFVVYTPSDAADNSFNASYGGYYKPYYEKVGNTLQLRGVPAPKSIHYYYAHHPTLFQSYLLRAITKETLLLVQPKPIQRLDPSKALLDQMRTLVESHHSYFVVGVAFDYQSERIFQFCTTTGMAYVRLQNPYIYPGNGNHWTPEGHEFVAKRIYDYLQGTQLLVRAGPKTASGARSNGATGDPRPGWSE